MFGLKEFDHWTRLWSVRLFYIGHFFGFITLGYVFYMIVSGIWLYEPTPAGMWIMPVGLVFYGVGCFGAFYLQYRYEQFVAWRKKDRVQNFARILRGE